MKLADIKGEKAFEVLANILTPISVLASDDGFNEARKVNTMNAVQYALREHPKELTAIFAYLDMEDPETYEINLLTLPKKVIEIINDPEVLALFPSQGQQMDTKPVGSATANIVETEK